MGVDAHVCGGLVAAAGGASVRDSSLVAFVAIASGAIGCVLAGRSADAWGKARIAGAAMVRQRLVRARRRPGIWTAALVLLVLAVCWGFSVVADSAQFSALVAEYSPRTHVGTALTLQICLGFLLTMISMRLLPIVASATGWQWAFLALVPGPVLGAVAMRRLAAASDGARPRFPKAQTPRSAGWEVRAS